MFGEISNHIHKSEYFYVYDFCLNIYIYIMMMQFWTLAPSYHSSDVAARSL